MTTNFDRRKSGRRRSPLIGRLSSQRGPLLRLVRDPKTAFLVVGLINTVLGVALFAGFDRLFGPKHYLLTLLCMHVVSVIVAFVLYRRLVFRVRGNLLRDAMRFESVYLTGLAINVVLLTATVELLHWRPLAAQVVIVAFNAFWSWFGHGRFSFRRPGSSGDPTPLTTGGAPQAESDAATGSKVTDAELEAPG